MTERNTPVVVCGVDGSDHAETAVRVAAELSRARGARLALVAVNPLSPGAGHPDIPGWTDAEQDALLLAAAHDARRLGAEVQCVATRGRDPAEALIAAAVALGADHIVVGTGDRKGVVNWLMGSVAKAVAARAQVSVTIAR
ncbi:MAG: universal stress protein [Bordetella sp.]|nr:universal stress protein [Bordetella sp.]